ncbi:chitin disaccharide deacetylase [Photobacterium japonica]|uniref:chitin disaccharide deacetylase n=1 Tax=Photobacterium japonica TaxID=2910235 RepID=UPI003D1266C8
MQIIFNADDFGLTEGINRGIINACDAGVVRSTTFMVGMAAESHAIALASATPQLKVGVHLRFTAGVPMSHGATTLIDDNGLFVDKSVLMKKTDICQRQVADEAMAQIATFLAHGLPLSHIDSHHHAHTHPQILPVIQAIARHYQVPLRGTGVVGGALSSCRYHFTDRFYGRELSVEGVIALARQYQGEVDVLEVMCHPAYVDDGLVAMSGYSHERAQERAILTDTRLMAQLNEFGIRIADYSALSRYA